MFTSFSLCGTYHSQTALKIQSFHSALSSFKQISIKLPSIQEPLKVLERTFNREVKLQHPREIYPLYEALTLTTREVAKTALDDLRSSWKQVLNSLHDREVYRIGLGRTAFDCSAANRILIKILEDIQKHISIQSVDIKIPRDRQKVVEYLYQIDREAFGACFQVGFLDEILKSDDVRCMAALDDKNEIIGILWGFLTDIQEQKIFHIWELSRKPSLAHLGIAKRLIEYAKQQQYLYPFVKFATLNVESTNHHAKELYDREQFRPLNEAGKKIEKIFMINKLSQDANGLPSDVSKTIVKNFVIKSISLPKLIYYELIRRCELIWRSCWFRD